jgi:hypothetical protein
MEIMKCYAKADHAKADQDFVECLLNLGHRVVEKGRREQSSASTQYHLSITRGRSLPEIPACQNEALMETTLLKMGKHKKAYVGICQTCFGHNDRCFAGC